MAQVDMLDAKSEPLRRSVQGTACQDVVEAIALVSAMAIEARATAATHVSSTTSTETAPAGVGRFEPVPAREKETRLPASYASREDRGWGVGVTGGISALSDVGNPLSIGVYGERIGAFPFRALRGTLARAAGSATLSDRDATFEWWIARLALCPVGWEATRGLELQACIGGDGGWLKGKGRPSPALPEPDSSTIFWAEVSSAIRVRWTLDRFLVLEAAGEVGFPLVRHRFHFDRPPEKVFEIPVARLGTTFSGGVRF